MKTLAFLFLFGHSWFAQSHTTNLSGYQVQRPASAQVALVNTGNTASAKTIADNKVRSSASISVTKIADKSPKDTIILKLKNRNKMMLITVNGDLTSFIDFDLGTVVRKLDSSRNDNGTIKTADSTIKLKPKTYRVVDGGSLTLIEVNRPVWTPHGFDSIMHDYKGWKSIRKKHRTTNQFDLDFGLNLYADNGKQVDSRAPYNLDNLNSRYFAMKLLSKTRIGPNGSPHHVTYGVELSWYNFRFQNKQRIEQDPSTGDLSWNPAPQGQEPYEDSKLTVAFMNIPIMYYYEAQRGLRFGVGGYVGYKLDEYSKVSQGGKTIRAGEGDFNLNSYQYGARAQVGWRGVDVFCNYNFSKLFRSGMGDNLTPIVFGISL